MAHLAGANQQRPLHAVPWRGRELPRAPLGSTIAANWAREFNYPGDNPKNLVEVAELLAANKCPDFIEDEGHYFGTDLSDNDKRALIEYIKYF